MNTACTDPHWTAYLTALLTPLIAVLGVCIATQQWRTAQSKLKFDLFEKRFSVYDAARNLIGSIMSSGKAKDEELFKFLAGTREAKWLFNAEVANYLEKQLYDPAIELQCLASELEGVPVGEARTKNVRRQADIKKTINAQFDELDRQFAPFLQLKH
ncbi:hypothetical protein J2S30_002333 [Herbaspirillum rubrisubalbicans]|uniref:hypothetical protein n=1 Tax=Herbaspirillum rubrisubalbicans TaxID=80842 RepID=UPI0020A04CBD|nr:hypothetical protein [Herbaspirillum rubrisubalbicans]MCP1573954.1 hypothetical protein [Herbaspirillum rubrisubalbicans]